MAKPYGLLRWLILPILRSRIWTIRGLDNLPTSGGYILTPNHQSWIDSALLVGAIYRRLHEAARFVAQSNKYGIFGGLPIESTDRAHVLDVAMKYLERGSPIVIFPEGNSNTKVELRMGKTGAARLALRSGLPVIPVGIKGTTGVRPWWAMIWFFTLIRPCHVVIGKPISFPKTELDENESELLRQTTDEIMRRISELSGKAMPGQGPILGKRGWLWALLWRVLRPLVQWRVRIHGGHWVPENGPFIVAANHPSYFDAPSLAMAVFHVSGLQPLFLTKPAVAETFHGFGGQTVLNALGMLPLDRHDPAKVLNPAIEHLHRGGVIGIFPEGKRNKPSLNPNWRTHLMKGKTGVARLAIATQVTIIPVSIVAPKGLSVREAVLKSFLPWHFFRVTFGPPVKLTNIPASLELASKEDLDRVTRDVMQAIAQQSSMEYPH
jgi:1-acyl-sn-glycerol-3-phosphate acyltransferase